jgi:peptide chain release factor 1
VTDHRIGLTVHQLDFVMDGKLDVVIDALITWYRTRKLEGDQGGQGAAAD